MPEESVLDGGDYRGYRVSVRLVREDSGLYIPRRVKGADDVYRFLKPLEELDREVFYRLDLDAKHRIVSCEEVSRGTVNNSMVHPREVYKGAILSSAAAIIVAHNHPSGDPTPSPEDRQVTDRLQQAGELLGIELLDHVIVGDGGFYSFAGSG